MHTTRLSDYAVFGVLLLAGFAFVAAATAGVGFALYALAWALMPTDASAAPARRIRTGRAAVEVGLGAGMLVLEAHEVVQ